MPVLGFSALQLSPDRDPLAPHADDQAPGSRPAQSRRARPGCAACPPNCSTTPPRIEASSPTARAALGYLHGNCGHCHNAAGALTGVELALAQQAGQGARSTERTLESLLGHASRFRPQGTGARRASLPATAAAS